MKLIKIDDYRWEVPQADNMNTVGRIYSNDAMITAIIRENAYQQVANVACLPGILGASLGMPDIHWGYGFPIGGVAAFDPDSGVISPGGVGYDINCGVRLAASSLSAADIKHRLDELADELYRNIPSGVGATGSLKLSRKEEKKVLTEGSQWAVRQGYGDDADIRNTEDAGCMENADPSDVSDRALERGLNQLGTLGSGNHFVEVGRVDAIYNRTAADRFGLFEGQVTLLIHSGSRGLGHQVCDDFLSLMTRQAKKTGIDLPDKQLSCAMINSTDGIRYFNAMACAANYAWANRQILLHRARKTFYRVFNMGPRDLSMNLVYDVCHNIAKKEEHIVDGKKRLVCVHRKGATRSFPPGHPLVCDNYRDIGQPILLPGDMGTASYVMVGTQRAMEETFGSTSHGAGRILSRKAAKKASKGRSIYRELQDKGILVRWTGKSTLSEEMPEAYKNISEVVDIIHNAGISEKVARLTPIVVIKG